MAGMLVVVKTRPRWSTNVYAVLRLLPNSSDTASVHNVKTYQSGEADMVAMPEASCTSLRSGFDESRAGLKVQSSLGGCSPLKEMHVCVR